MTSRANHVDEVLARIESSLADLHSPVEASWRRSVMLHGLDPAEMRRADRLTDTEHETARERMAEVLHHAGPALDRLFSLIGQGGCGIVLTDPDGVIVEHRVAPEDETAFRRANLWRKGVWSEAAEGTNGIGTCLAEGRALSIRRDQHFAQRNIGLTCIDAPLWGPEGELVGALDVSNARRDETEGTIRLVEAVMRDTAAWIETELFRSRYEHERIMMGPPAGQGRVSLIALDKDDLLVGASRAARKALGITRADFGRPPPDLQKEVGFDAAERREIVQALARAKGNASAAARDLGISRATLYRRMHRHGVER